MVKLYRRERSPYYYAIVADSREPGGFKRISTRRTDQREAEQVAIDLQTQTDREIDALGGLKWLDACEDFLARADLKQSTKAGYVSLASNIATSTLGDFNLRALSKSDLQAFVRARRQDEVMVRGADGKPVRSTGRRVSDATIRRHLSFISAVIAWAMDQELPGAPEENIAKQFDRSGLKEARPTDRHLRPAQFKAILESLDNEVDRRILIVLVGTGMRMSELLDLRWGEVDLKRNIIEFGNIDPTRTKSSRARRIPILPPVREALLAQCANTKCVVTGFIFPSPLGDHRRFDLSSLRRRVKKGAKLKSFRIHDLRHTFASWALQQGVDPFALAMVLGHSDVSTTARYARHVSDSVLAQFKDINITH